MLTAVVKAKEIQVGSKLFIRKNNLPIAHEVLSVRYVSGPKRALYTAVTKVFQTENKDGKKESYTRQVNDVYYTEGCNKVAITFIDGITATGKDKLVTHYVPFDLPITVLEA